MHIGHYDAELSSKLRQIARELKDWATLAEKNKLGLNHIKRMKFEADSLQKLIGNKEL